jgi:ketosteroid isomerase-like protein
VLGSRIILHSCAFREEDLNELQRGLGDFISCIQSDNRSAISAERNRGLESDSDAEAPIRKLVDKYTQSIDDADTKLGAEVWSPTSDVSFVQPQGNQQGWDQIADVFYGKIMGGNFSKRTLKTVGDLNIQIYGDAAVVLFNWDFVAVLRADGKTIHTTGRESQVYAKLRDKGWRLVHVHYSGPPVSGLGQGF